MELWRYFLIFTVLFVLIFCRDVTYDELETLGVKCDPYDTCNSTSSTRGRRNCECDQNCAQYGDCCLDAPNHPRYGSRMSPDLVCIQIRPDAGYYALGKCMRGWRDANVRRKCEGRPNPIDPFTSVPVAAVETGFTYKNHHCATCNRVRGALSYWKLGADCPSLTPSMEDYVKNNLTYDEKRASLGVDVEGTFHRCNLQLVDPKDKRFLRFCYPNVISKCSSGWRDEIIREKCEAYTAYVHIREDEVTYRNAHCALCNNVRINQLSCDYSFKRDFERTSFTTLFDINLSKGNTIGGGGTAPKCGEGEAYDAAFKRCQKLSCGLPFLELRDGVCVRKS